LFCRPIFKAAEKNEIQIFTPQSTKKLPTSFTQAKYLIKSNLKSYQDINTNKYIINSINKKELYLY